MADPIHEMKPGADGASVSIGYYAVNTDGHLVLVVNAPLTTTQRLATAAEVARARQLASPPTEAPPIADAWTPNDGAA